MSALIIAILTSAAALIAVALSYVIYGWLKGKKKEQSEELG
jgi:hypothetical protein